MCLLTKVISDFIPVPCAGLFASGFDVTGIISAFLSSLALNKKQVNIILKH
jgi:hypothetical protein